MKKHRKNPDLKAMFMADYVKAIAEPYEGVISKRRIYMREIAHRVPICMSSFYRYMRISTADYPVLMDEYARRQCERAERELRELNERRRRKRLAAAMAECEAAETDGSASRQESPQTRKSEMPSTARRPQLAASDVDSKSVPIPYKARKDRFAAARMSEPPEADSLPHSRVTETEDVLSAGCRPGPAEINRPPHHCETEAKEAPVSPRPSEPAEA